MVEKDRNSSVVLWPSMVGIVVLVLLLFAPLVSRPTEVLYSPHSDLLAMHLPMKRFMVRSYQEDGELPRWCRHSYAGMPFLHDVQVAAFYPPHWFLLLLDEEHVGMAMSWLIVLHVLLAGMAMLTYAHWSGLRGLPAFIAAACYALSGKWLLHMVVGGHVIMAPLAWLPLILLALESSIVNKKWIHAVVSGSLYSLIILGTHPQMTLYAGLFIGLWSLRQTDGSRQSIVRWLAMGALTLLTACLLSAVQLVPALEAAAQASRSTGVPVQDVLAASLPTLAGLFGPGMPASWEGRGGLVVCLMVAAIGGAWSDFPKSRFTIFVACAILAFGLGGAALVQWLPGFRLFQIPGRALILLGFPLALLAGRGCDREALRGPPITRVFLFVWLIALVFVGVSHIKEWQHAPDATPWYLIWLLLLGPLGGLLLARSTTYLPWLVVLDCMMLVWPHVDAKPLDRIYPENEIVTRLAREPGRVLERALPDDASSAPIGCALPMFGDVRIQPVMGYNTFDVRRYKELLQMISGEPPPVVPRRGIFGFPISGPFPIRARTAIDMMGVMYLVEPASPAAFDDNLMQPIGSWARETGLHAGTEVYSFLGGGMQALPAFSLYRNTRAFPRAWTVSKSALASEGVALVEQLRSTDFRDVVVLAGASAMKDERDFDATGSSCEVTATTTNGLHMVVAAPKPCYLVVSEVVYPGWRCCIDGDEVREILPANHAFMAVPITAGHHKIEWRFDPVSLKIGRAVSLVSLALFSILLVFEIWRRWNVPPRLPA